MANSSSTAQIDHAVATHGLSKRAARNSLQDLPWDSLEKMMANLWEPGNPDGLVFLGVAENPLLHDEVIKHIESHFAITAGDHLGYGVGPRGSPRLRKAMAEFFTSDFKAHEPVLPEQVLVLPGVVAVLDALSWAICDEEEGILVPLPFYTGFKPAVRERARGRIIPASFRQIKGYLGLDDVFDPHMNRQALEDAFRNAANDGVKARAVMLSNPHNPLGRCYPAETLKEIARFCGRHKLHLISDEIFADSVYDNKQAPNLAAFTSILALDLSDCIDPVLVHVAYGMGKDFGATGLRVGTLHSRNEGLIAAVTSICVFGWVPYVTQDIWASMLESPEFLVTLSTKKQKILKKHCRVLTRFLDQHEIPYYANTNAGVFVWVDLRRYLHSEVSRNAGSDLSLAQASPSQNQEMLREQEARLFQNCLAGGVGIALGSSFSSEEIGWFRISFTVEERALHVGLQRLLTCLQAMEA